MAYKTVIYLLRVPSGDYCWEWVGDRSICDYFHAARHPVCPLFNGTPKRDDVLGYKKLAKCLKSKDK